MDSNNNKEKILLDEVFDDIESVFDSKEKKSKKMNLKDVVSNAKKVASKTGEAAKVVAYKTAEGAKKVASDTKDYAKEKVIPAGKQTATKIKDSANSLVNKAKNIITEEQMQEILNNLYIQSVNGIPKVSLPIDDLVNDYVSKNKDIDSAIKSLINNSTVKCGTSGFITGLGGFTSMLATLPANITSVMYVQLRMCCAIAKMGGFDITSDQVQTMIYACLTGSAMSDVLKQAGIKFGNKFGAAMIKKIPGAALTKINQKVGFRFVTKFGQQGLVNLGKVVPVLGGLIGGGVDIASTRVIGNNAYKLFIKGEVPTEKESEEILNNVPVDVEAKIVDDVDMEMFNNSQEELNSSENE